MSDIILLATVPYTGTNSMMRELNETRHSFISQIHCNERTLNMCQHQETYTTWRDPRKVAASFANRLKIRQFGMFDKWLDWWKYWGLSVPFVTVVETDTLAVHENKSEDRTGAMKAFYDKDWDEYYSIVPISWIEAVLDSLPDTYLEKVNGLYS